MPDYVDIDPVTKQPVQAGQAAPAAQPGVVQQSQPQQQWSPEAFAAQSAEAQMLESRRRGGQPTQEEFENARKEAYQQAMQTQREMALERQRQQAELGRAQTMQQFEQFAPRRMSEDEIKDASGLLNAHQQIMMVHHQNQDIPENDAYRTTALGGLAAVGGKMTDPRVRLYEATRGGAVIALGRGLLQDTGQVAGKEQAQDLIRQLMPGPGDSTQMSGRKTIDMVQMELNGLNAKINSLPSNVDSGVLKDAYSRAYADYAPLVNQYGSDAQRNYAAPSPQQLWGGQTGTAGQVAQVVQPAVKAGFSQATNDTLNAQLTGAQPKPVATPQPAQQTGQQALRAGQQPALPLPSQPASASVGAAAQQAGQYAGGPTVMTPQNMQVPTVQQMNEMLQTPPSKPTVWQTAPQAVGQAVQATGQGVGATLGWMQGLLPENWSPQSFQR